MNQETIGQRIKRLRKQKGYNQIELAYHAGCNQGALSNYERGKRTPNMDIIISMAEALDVSLDYLLTGDSFVVRETAEITYTISDNGMAPEIKEKDIITITSTPPEENAIALVEVKEKTYIARRVQYLSGKEINLLPSNSEFLPIHGSKSKLKILGTLRTLHRTY